MKISRASFLLIFIKGSLICKADDIYLQEIFVTSWNTSVILEKWCKYWTQKGYFLYIIVYRYIKLLKRYVSILKVVVAVGIFFKSIKLFCGLHFTNYKEIILLQKEFFSLSLFFKILAATPKIKILIKAIKHIKHWKTSLKFHNSIFISFKILLKHQSF